MKNITIIIVFFTFLLTSSCSKDDSPTRETITYTLHAVANPDIQGTVKFSENEDGTTTVVLAINGSSTDIHPAYIYNGKEEGTGSIAITLLPIDCACESSTTLVSKLDNGTGITFKGLKALNAHVKIHQSSSEMGTVIAQGNIGANAK